MVMSDEKLPVKSDNRALAAVREQELAQRLAEMRKEVARAEKRLVHYVCARTGGRFFARFERDEPEGRFRIAAIEKEAAPEKESGLFGGLFRRSAPQPQPYAAKEFDRRGWYCPYCEAKGGSIYCDECNQNVCKGRTRNLPSGKEFFVCQPACGATGALVDTDKIRGSCGGSELKRAGPAQLEAPSRPALPGAAVPRLAGPGK
jgi:hypothetical protein